MLVLERRKKETITIGDNITVTVYAIHGDKVKLAIKAPKEVEVHRFEVWLRIQQDRQAANNEVQ